MYKNMTSLKPYLVRSVYEWIVDNDLTPYLLVDASHPDALLPEAFIEEGRIVLNIRPAAVQSLLLGNKDIEFNARFSGRPMHVVVPVKAILAVYAKENGRGMVFDDENDDSDDTPPPSKKPPIPSRPQLRIVK
jgi:stringent starvation protein B